MKTKMMLTSFVATLALGLLVTTPITATTPDGITPAEETVCDVLQADGTTKGLYGLCVAYCEATDSPENLYDDEGNFAPITEEPSAVLLEIYNKKRAKADAGDPQMPCATYYEDSECPAWTNEQLYIVGTHVPYASEIGQHLRYDDRHAFGRAEFYDDYEGFADSYGTRDVRNYARVVKTGDGLYLGVYADREFNNTIGGYIRNINNTVPLTEDQYQACFAQISAHVMPTQIP